MSLLDLTELELRVLAMDMEHAPSCAWSEPQVHVLDSDGEHWTDATLIVPWNEPACTCGYFAAMDSARAKIRAHLSSL